MGKNNKLINQMRALAMEHSAKNVQKAIEDMTPLYFAAMALALHRDFGFGQDRTMKAFQKTLDIWQEFEGRGEELTAVCQDELGITITKD